MKPEFRKSGVIAIVVPLVYLFLVHVVLAQTITTSPISGLPLVSGTAVSDSSTIKGTFNTYVTSDNNTSVDGLDFLLKKDTVTKIIEELDKEKIVYNSIDIIVYNETEIEVNDTIDSFALEFGSFTKESDADTLRVQMSTLLGKEAELIFKNERYKVCLTGFATRDDVEDYFLVLQSKGIIGISLIRLKGILEPMLVANTSGIQTDTIKTIIENDTTILAVHNIVKEDTITSPDNYVIEFGTFANEAKEETLLSQKSTLADNEAKIVFENEQYKVHKSGIASAKEVEEYNPKVQSKGIDEISLISQNGIAEPTLVTNISGIQTDPIKFKTEKDNTVLAVHSTVKEDTTTSTDNYVVELGTFANEAKEDTLLSQKSTLADNKAQLVFENKQYKVHKTGIASVEKVEEYNQEVQSKGVYEISPIKLKDAVDPRLVTNIPGAESEPVKSISDKDATDLIVHEIIAESMTSFTDSYVIQVGAFKREYYASRLRTKFADFLSKEVTITAEDEFYKVRIVGFESMNEIEQYVPVLGRRGISEVWMVTVNGMVKQGIVLDKNEPDPEEINTFTEKNIRKKEELRTKPIKELASGEIEVKKNTIEEPRKDVVVTQSPVAKRSTIEERLLVAEYRTDIYETRWPGMEFVIQIAASKSINDPEVIKRKFGLSGDVKVTRADEWYRFNTGKYIKFWQAREYRNILSSRNGIEDAMIVAYKNGKKIMYNDLLAIAENTQINGLPERPALSKAFSVQVLATKDVNVSVTSLRELYEVDEEIFKEYDVTDGLYRYSIGNYTLYTDAAKIRNQIKLSGFKGVFVTGYKNGKRQTDLRSLLM